MTKTSDTRRGVGRRQVLKTGGAGAAVAALAATGFAPRRVLAQTQRKVSFSLPWLAGGTNLFTYVAKAKGFWSKRGLDVELSRGYGSVAAAQAIGTGKFEYGLTAAPAAIEQTIKGLPLVNLACCNYESTMGIAVLGDSPIKEPKDLEGKKLGATVTSGEYPFLPALAKKTGFDWSKVQVVALDPQVRQRALIGKQVDAISAFSTASIPAMIVEGVDARFLSFDRYGINLYGLSLVTQPERVRTDKAMTQAVIEGALEGLAFTLTDPDESIAIFKNEVKEFAASPKALEREALGFNMMQLSILAEEARKSGIGWQRPEAFAGMTDLIMTYLVPGDTKRPEVASLYTNEFVGGIRLNEADWKAAEARYAKYRKYLG